MTMLFILAVSPFVPAPPSTFFFFSLLNAAVQSTAGAYFQTAVVGLASMFGPFAIQAVFAGMAAVGVLVSLVQYITAAVSVVKKIEPGLAPPVDDPDHNASASTSAFLFFSVSTLFLAFSLVVHAWLLRLPAFRELQNATKSSRISGLYLEEEEEETTAEEVSSPTEDRYLVGVEVPAKPEVSVWSVAKLNIMYNIAVGYTFVVSLVSLGPP